MDESLIPYTSAIRTAPTLGQAGEMYSKCPAALLKADEKGECRRAMLAAMAPGITPEMAAAVSKLMRNQDLIAVARK